MRCGETVSPGKAGGFPSVGNWRKKEGAMSEGFRRQFSTPGEERERETGSSVGDRDCPLGCASRIIRVSAHEYMDEEFLQLNVKFLIEPE